MRNIYLILTLFAFVFMLDVGNASTVKKNNSEISFNIQQNDVDLNINLVSFGTIEKLSLSDEFKRVETKYYFSRIEVKNYSNDVINSKIRWC